MNCQKCGTPLNEGQKFCTICGTPCGAPTTKRMCPNCASELMDGACFCFNCGAPVQAAPAENAQPALAGMPAAPVQESGTAPEQPAQYKAEAPKAASVKRNAIILVVVLVVLLAGTFATLFAVGASKQANISETLTLAERYLDEQEYEQAIIEFEKLLEIDPKNADAYIGLAQAYEALGDYDKATMALEQAKENVDEADKERIEAAIAELEAAAVETEESAENTTAATTAQTTAAVIAETVETVSSEGITENETFETFEQTEEAYHPTSLKDAIDLYGYSEIVENCNGEGQNGYVYNFVWQDDKVIKSGSVWKGCHVYEAKTILIENDINNIWSRSFWTDNEITIRCNVQYYDGPDSGYYILSDSTDAELPFLDGRKCDICLNETEPFADDLLQRYGVFPCSITVKDYGVISTQFFGGYFADVVDIKFLSEPDLSEMAAPDPFEVELMLYNVIHNNNYLSVTDMQMLSGVTSLIISGGGGNDSLGIYVECGNKTGTEYIGLRWTAARYAEVQMMWEPYHISDLSFLSYLTSIESLSVICCDVSDISVISELTTLKSLDLTNNRILDLAPIANLTNLESLVLYGNGNASRKYTNISAIGNLKNLRLLDICTGGYDNLSFLTQLTNLEYLYLDGGLSDDLSELDKMTDLKGLTISGSNITDITSLADKAGLTELCIRDTSVSDISVLTNFKNLKLLSLMYNAVTDITPIKELTQLEKLYLSEYLISIKDCEDVRDALPNLIR